MSALSESGTRRSNSTLRRILNSPLSILARGRIIDQLKHAPPASGLPELPPSIRECVQRVAKESRLWRSERADVTRELATHFLDGLAVANSAEKLIQDFGDPTVAASLIRRSKKRNRPIWYRGFVRSFQGLAAFLALLVVTYGVSAARVYLSSPRISRNFAAEYNAPVLAVPESERAWPLYRQGFLSAAKYPFTGSETEITSAHRDWQELKAYVNGHQDAIALFRQAATKQNMGPITPDASDPQLDEATGVIPAVRGLSTSDDMLFTNNVLPELIAMRAVARLLRIDAFVAMERGDGTRMATDIQAMIGTVEHVSQRPLVMTDLVAMTILDSTTQVVGYALSCTPALLDEQSLVGLSHRLASIRGGGRLTLRLEFEHMRVEDLLQRMYTDDGHGDGHLSCTSPQWFVAMQPRPYQPKNREVEPTLLDRAFIPVLALLDAGRQKNLRRFDEVISEAERAARLPLWERRRCQPEATYEPLGHNWHALLNRLRFPLVNYMPESFERANFLMELTNQRRDAALVAVALELSRRQHGSYPGSLGELTPRYLPVVPTDRFDGKPLKYKLENGKAVLYSVGSDRRDDGGHWPGPFPRSASSCPPVYEWCFPEDVELSLKYKMIAPGDWVLWPPVEEWAEIRGKRDATYPY